MFRHRYATDTHERFAPDRVAEGGGPDYGLLDEPLDLDALLAEVGMPAHAIRALRGGVDDPGPWGAPE